MTTFLVCLLIIFILATAGCYVAGPLGWFAGLCLGIFIVLAGTTPGGLILATIALIVAGLAIEAHYEGRQERARKARKALELDSALWNTRMDLLHKEALDHVRDTWVFWSMTLVSPDDDWHKEGRRLYIQSLVTTMQLVKSLKGEDYLPFWEELHRRVFVDCKGNEDIPMETRFYNVEELRKHVPNLYLH